MHFGLIPKASRAQLSINRGVRERVPCTSVATSLVFRRSLSRPGFDFLPNVPNPKRLVLFPFGVGCGEAGAGFSVFGIGVGVGAGGGTSTGFGCVTTGIDQSFIGSMRLPLLELLVGMVNESPCAESSRFVVEYHALFSLEAEALVESIWSHDGG